MLNRLDWYTLTQEFRQYWPTEWQCMPWVIYVPRKGTYEAAIYMVMDGIAVRADLEVDAHYEIIEDKEYPLVGGLAKRLWDQFNEVCVDTGEIDELLARLKREQNVEAN